MSGVWTIYNYVRQAISVLLILLLILLLHTVLTGMTSFDPIVNGNDGI